MQSNAVAGSETAPNPLGIKYKTIGIMFDIIAAIVSLLDLSTDLIILITWFNEGRMIFFYISLCILILAQICYIAVFYFNHGHFDSSGKWILSLLCSIIFAPFLSFIFYFVSDNDSCLRRFIDNYLCCFDFQWNSRTADPNQSPQQQYLDEKLYKHLGFIIEASIEAFPQSILQLTAIVYYNEPNIISILSILISMTSVCSKILLLVLSGNSIGWKLKLFIWLCFVVDFVGIFFIVSYAFHTPTDEYLHAYFLTIRNIYFWQFYICILPFAVIGSFGLNLYWTIDISSSTHNYVCLKSVLIFCGITLIQIIGLFITLLIMEIFCVIWAGMIVSYVVPSSRMPYKKKAEEFFSFYFDWISIQCHDIIDITDNKSILITKHRDKMMRLCIFNKIILEQHPELTKDTSQNQWETAWNNHYDEKLLNYLQNEQKTQYNHVTLTQMRANCDDSVYIYNHNNKQGLSRYAHRRHPNVYQSLYYEFYASMFVSLLEGYRTANNNNNIKKCNEGIGVVTLGILTFICGPLYILSRIFNVFFPLFLVLFFYFRNGNGLNLFVDLDGFQIIMCCLYVVLFVVWFFLAIFVQMEDYYLWHILPSTDNLKGCEDMVKNNKVRKLIENCYFNMTMYPLIQKIVSEKFGNDIACVVMQYFNSIQLQQNHINTDNATTII